MKKLLGAILALLTVAVVIVWLWKNEPADKQPPKDTEHLSGEVITVPEDKTPEDEPQPEIPPEPEVPDEPEIPATGFDTTSWELLLVNPWNPVPEDYEMSLVNLPNGMQADPRVYDALMEMLDACKADGLHAIVGSAYRSYDTQVRLYNNKIQRLINQGYDEESARREAGRVVAVPGTSEHQTGMAFDIVALSYQLLEEDQENTAEQKWLMEHCYEYGFILRYPKDKEDITGIIYEPWHYRYVGKEAALAIRDSGLCLEEWLGTTDEASLPRLPFNG